MTTTDILIRLIVGFICGLGIGSERQIHHRTAGLRTNALVALGACAFVLFDFLNHESFGTDFRASAQVVSGIGFLGGGVILKDGFNIKGLTTAATLWCSAGAGMLAGMGHLEIAGIVALFVMGINTFLRPLNTLLNKVSPDKQEFLLKISCDVANEDDVKWIILKYLEKNALILKDIKIEQSKISGKMESHISAMILSKQNKKIDSISHEIAKDAKILSIMWENIG
jgi:putative Mg2+ transporter-C (MgtC) family protein